MNSGRDNYLTVSDTKSSISSASSNYDSNPRASTEAPGTSEPLVPIESIPRCRDFALDSSKTHVPSPDTCYFGARASKILKEQLVEPQPGRNGRKSSGKCVTAQDEEKLKDLFGEDAQFTGVEPEERKPITWKTKVFNPLRILRERQE